VSALFQSGAPHVFASTNNRGEQIPRRSAEHFELRIRAMATLNKVNRRIKYVRRIVAWPLKIAPIDFFG
jgi:hypothetical protein